MGILRVFLAIAVIAAHFGGVFGNILVGGKIAVQAFYIISGFYMSLILNEKYIGENKSYGLFISNRFFRLYPIYWVVLLLALSVSLIIQQLTGRSAFHLVENYQAANPDVFTYMYLIVSQIAIFGLDLALFMGMDPSNGSLFFTSDFWNTSPQVQSLLLIPQAWTIGIELMFYLIAPFILRRSPKFVLGLLISSFVLRLYLYNSLNLVNDPWTYRFFPTELFFFLLGYFIYQLYLKIKHWNIPNIASYTVLLFVLLITIFFEDIPTTAISGFPFNSSETFYFLLISISIPVLFKMFKSNSIDQSIGELSYPAYISHFLVAGILGGTAVVVTQLDFIKQGWFIVLMTLLFSFLLNKYIATPIEKYRQSRVK